MGKASNRDSITSKVFGKGGMGFGEGREKLFFRKVFPPFPNIHFPYTIFTPPIQWAATRPLRVWPSHGVLWLLE